MNGYLGSGFWQGGDTDLFPLMPSGYGFVSSGSSPGTLPGIPPVAQIGQIIKTGGDVLAKIAPDLGRILLGGAAGGVGAGGAIAAMKKLGILGGGGGGVHRHRRRGITATELRGFHKVARLLHSVGMTPSHRRKKVCR